MFLAFSLMLIPTIQGYKSGDAYEGEHFVGYANTMISNMGYSSVECRNIPVSLGNIALTCPYGTVGKILDYGVNNPDSGSPVDACQNNQYNKKCRPDTGHFWKMMDTAIGTEHKNIKFTMSDLFWRAMDKECTDTTNLLFVQYSCVQNKTEQSTKYNHLVVASTTASLISLLFVVVLQNLYKGGKIQQLEWDISTVTAGDYTVEYEIDKQSY